jgi:hypothetical protein
MRSAKRAEGQMGLFAWFRSKPECPVDPETRKWIDHRWRWLEAEFGPDHIRKVPVVLPRPEFFPDPYNATELQESVDAIHGLGMFQAVTPRVLNPTSRAHRWTLKSPCANANPTVSSSDSASDLQITAIEWSR